ncbi:hypothetical protein DQ04_01771000 [Trypanosoma grayi]|uniref:hypothetical protein n=1 Tax=Trypanosoma grayi TaxID=71804 RepID=UPI0004F4758C|nr:hypothetical protein DQ04_01771000 [Trypanosoma grayi]KEG12352.1 hypothetical protein DQ04_01771000 [Trypanosoma grayi]
MELDVASDGEVYVRSLQEAKWEILKGADAAKDWQQIQGKHPFFRDIIKDAEQQARVLASVLAATEFVLQQLLCVGENSAEVGLVDVQEVKHWRTSLAGFLSIYESSPVPTRARWETEVQGCGGEVDVNGDEDDDDGSFVEAHLRELVRQCLAAGKKWCRQQRGDDGGVLAAKLRGAVAVMDAFAAPRTLEW